MLGVAFFATPILSDAKFANAGMNEGLPLF
jgi:hypothetical protein